MTLLDEFARLLDQLDLGTYDATGSSGDIFLRKLPPQPVSAIAVARYGGAESDSKLPYDEVRLQFRVRGSNTDARDPESRAQAIYDALHGLANRLLPGGTWLELCLGSQGGPIDMPADEHGHDQCVVNMRASLQRLSTTNRP